MFCCNTANGHWEEALREGTLQFLAFVLKQAEEAARCTDDCLKPFQVSEEHTNLEPSSPSV